MKYFIVGLHSSGKQRILDNLKTMGVHTGSIFRSTEKISDKIYSLSSIVYTPDDVNSIAEGRSYVFFDQRRYGTKSFYEGLSLYEYDNNDVFIISPHQFSLIPHFDDDVVFIWLDNSNQQRLSNYKTERRKYDYFEQERLDGIATQDLIERIYDHKYLYFLNENPDRVSTVVCSLIRHPDLLDIFIENYK